MVMFKGSKSSRAIPTRKDSKRKANTMSKVETPEKTSKTLEGSIKAYNLDTLALVDASYKVEFEPAKDSGEAITRLGSDEATILSILNAALESKTLQDERTKAFTSNMVPKASVLKHVNVYRNSPKYAKLVTVERGHKDWKEQYAGQTAAILNDVKDVPFIMDAIRAEKIQEDSEVTE